MVLAKLVAEGVKSPEKCPHVPQVNLEQFSSIWSNSILKYKSHTRCIVMDKKSILFLCTGNSCRSQMAESWARHLHDKTIEPFSAGLIRHGLDQRTVKVMAETGVDISEQISKTVDDLPELDFDAVITLCDSANESCPFFPGKFIRLHRSFDDPLSVAKGTADEEKVLEPYRRVRDEIRSFVEGLPDILAENLK